jgi:hypothetical protein
VPAKPLRSAISDRASRHQAAPPIRFCVLVHEPQRVSPALLCPTIPKRRSTTRARTECGRLPTSSLSESRAAIFVAAWATFCFNCSALARSTARPTARRIASNGKARRRPEPTLTAAGSVSKLTSTSQVPPSSSSYDVHRKPPLPLSGDPARFDARAERIRACRPLIRSLSRFQLRRRARRRDLRQMLRGERAQHRPEPIRPAAGDVAALRHSQTPGPAKVCPHYARARCRERRSTVGLAIGPHHSTPPRNHRFVRHQRRPLAFRKRLAPEE